MSRPSGDIPQISVIVPTRNSARTLEQCLRSVRAQTHPDVELIVVDNHSDDATATVAAEWADLVLHAGPERSAQRNLGAAAASGGWLCFVDSDMVLTPQVLAEAVATVDHPSAPAALIVPERSVGDGFWARCRALEKRCYDGSEAEAARIFRRDVFARLGGYDEQLTGGEDWDLPDRLVRAGHAIGRIRAVIVHDEGRPTLVETFRTKRYYGVDIPRYVRKQRAVGLRRLARTSLFSQPGLLAAQPVVALGMLLLKMVDAAGLVTGMVTRRVRPT